jgi:S-(hydroxymethyl)glutathione dehydrogenase/alcohol dehydrogenase
MKAAILEKLNKPLAVKDIEIPTLACGQVLIEVHHSGICGAQIGEISGAKGEDKYLPHLLGHEGAGVVVDTGLGVNQVKKGDHVVMHWRKGAGIEAMPPKYKYNGGYVGGGWVTTLNEYAVVSENRVTAIDKDVPFDVAALMGCGVTTGLGLINNEAQLKIGQSITVIGCGGVGLNVIQGAAMVSANPIVAIDIYDEKLAMAKKLGASYTFNIKYLGASLLNIIKGTVKGGVDVVVDCTGIPEMIDNGYAMVSPGGKMILVGQPKHEANIELRSMRQHYCGKTLMDSQGGLTNPTVDIPKYLNLYMAGKLKLDELITDYYKLGDINEAVTRVKSGQAGRVMVEMK